MQHPTKSSSGVPDRGFEQSDYVDLNGNLWVTGAVSISGLTLVSGTIPISVPLGITLPVTITGTPSTNITQVGGAALGLGQKLSAASIPVVIASNQSPLDVALPSPARGTAPQNSSSIAYEASRLVKTSPGVLFGFQGYNSKATAQFIQVFDSSVLPADASVPVFFFTVSTTGNFSVAFPASGRAFNAGICLTNSSTGPTKTIGSADCWFDAQFS